MAQLEKKSFSSPDQSGTPPKAKMAMVNVGGRVVGRMTFEPGWKWSVDLGSAMGKEVCPMHHFGYQESGTMQIRMQDGTELTVNAGDIVDIPPGHDAWVVGDQSVVLIDFGDPEAK